MNKRQYVTKARINEVAKFLEESAKWLIKNDCGCCCHLFDGDEDVALYVGWSAGYDPEDTSVFLSPLEEGNTTCYGINAGIKIRNDYDCADYEFLDFPLAEMDCVACEIFLGPDTDYQCIAKYLLQDYVDVRNGIDKGYIKLTY